MIPSTQHSTTGNHKPIPKPEPVHSPDICPSPEKLSQDVDKSHLSDSTSSTHSLHETVLWIPQVTICFVWILPAFHLNYKTPQVLKVLYLNLFLILRT